MWEYDRRVTTIDGEPVVLTLRAKDPEGEDLAFEFGAEAGELDQLDTENEGEGVWVCRARWSPTGLEIGNNYDLWCKVSDTGGNTRQGDTQAIVLTTGHILMGDPVLESQSRQLSPAQLDFGTEESELTTELTIEPLEEGGEECLPWRMGHKPDWISDVSPDHGEQSGTITVTIDRSAMAPGRYTGDILFEFVAPDQVLYSALSVKADVSGGSGALLAVGPTSLDFGTGDTSLTFAITNGGAGTLEWSCAPSDSWIGVSDESGTNGATVTVTVERSGLSEGAHTGGVAVTSNGGSSSVAVSMAVAPAGTPTVGLEATPTSGSAPLAVAFTGTGSDSDGTVVLYSLDFGDSTAPWSDASPPTGLEHTYADAGSYSPRLTATDDDGKTGTASAPVTVDAAPSSAPVVTLTATPSSGVVPLSVTFDGTATDDDGPVAGYRLDFGDDSVAWSDSARPQNVAHSFGSVGTHTATLIATDGGGTEGSASVTVRVLEPGAPLAETAWPMRSHDLRHSGLSSHFGAQTATLRWQFATGGEVWGGPAIGADGTVYIGSDDSNLYAINPDGTEKWRFVTGEAVLGSPAVGADGTVYIGSGDGNLYAINPDGTEKWRLGTGYPVRSSPAIGADGTVYVGTGGIGSGHLRAVNPDGTEKWRLETIDWTSSSPAIGADGTIYVGSDCLYAADPSGAEKWRFWIGGHVYSSPAIGADGTIFIGGLNENVYALDPDGTEKWRFAGVPLTTPIVSSPAVGADGTVYIGTESPTFCAIGSDGTEKWRLGTRYAVRSSDPAIGADGTIYVGSGTDLYAIGEGQSSADVIIHGVRGARR